MGKNDVDIILEAFDDKLKTVGEALQSIKVNTDTIPEIHERLSTLEEKVEVIEKAVKSTNIDTQGLDERVATLESA